MQSSQDRSPSIELQAAWKSSSKATTAPSWKSFQLLSRLLRTWHERERQRRELSMMSRRDFGDLPLSPGLVRDDIRRWPWQKYSLR